MPIRVLLANNQELLKAGLRIIFQSEPDIELVGIANDFEETIALSDQYAPDVVLFDYMLQETDCVVQDDKCLLEVCNGIEKIPEILNANPSSKVLIMTACLSRERHLLALRQGAIGVFLLNQPIELLIKAIYKVYSGEVWIPNSLANELLKGFNKSESTDKVKKSLMANTLTPRELEIARLLAQGFPPKQIAERLYVSEKTIRNKMTLIYDKLGIHSQIELMLNANQLGIQDSSK